MAVVQISRIQHRRGKSEDLPQLASAELGWSINNRKLYIGNGSTVEGAPTVGNTEILTEHSNILSGSNSYIYKGERSGYTASGTSSRQLQQKLDETVSVLDFGAKGDGSTDDTTAINTALYQLYCVQDTDALVRRRLYFPAGTYVVNTNSVKVPPYAHLVGDGQEKTFIKNTKENTAVLRTADSDQNTSASIGTGTAITPRYITIQGMTLHQTVAYECAYIEQCNEIRFNDVGFKGRLTSGPSSVGSKHSTVKIDQTATHVASHIVFDGCDFSFSEVGVLSDIAFKNVVFDKCSFSYLYEAFRIGENISSGNPSALRIQHSHFDKITGRAIYLFNGKGCSSSFNTYRDCATNLVGAGNPIAAVVDWNDDGNGNFGDWFERNDTDAETFPRIEHNGKEIYSTLADNYVAYGYHKSYPGKKITLADNVSTATSTGLTFSRTTEQNLQIGYTISRNSRIRTGTLFITNTSANSSIADEFIEEADVGVVFELDRTGGVTTLKFTSNNQSANAEFYYKIDKYY